MSQQALLTRIVEALDGAGIAYMLTESFASSLQGEPRASHDIDLVIDITSEDAARVAQALCAPGIYLDEHAVSDATRRRTMFDLVDSSSGDKADFWLLTDDPYDRERFARRLRIAALGLELSVSAPEGTITHEAPLVGAGRRQREADRRCRGGLRTPERASQVQLDKWLQILRVSATLAGIRSGGSAEDQGRGGRF